ncbi:MAG: hypothetical protein K0Q95_191 [Bacteroidota bacterium]|jgi:hypothetical protein|nr:hypothetical protein [Bacteroidota bacterium]
MKFLLYLFIFFNALSKAFSQTVPDSTESKWQKGYIVLKTSPDTIKGYLQIKLSRFDQVTKVKFRPDPEKRKGTLFVTVNNINNISADTIKYFGVQSKHYKFLNYGDFIIQRKNNSIQSWVEILETGPMEISRGFHIGMRGNGSNAQDTYTPAYYLHKKNSSPVIIAAPTIELIRGHDYLSYEIDEVNKAHFTSYISENEELAESIRNKKLLFRDIEEYAKTYNTWKRSKN